MEKRKKGLRLLMLGGLLGILFLMYITSSFYGNILKKIGLTGIDANSYKYHYVMIVENLDSLFWNDVYQNVKKEAALSDAYVELKGKDRASEYTILDFMDSSINANVDGILLQYTGEDGLAKLIDQASQKGIPVVTMLNDTQDTKRISYVGANAYQLGQVYINQILNMLPKDKDRVRLCILMSDDSVESSQSQIFFQINSQMLAYGETQSQIIVEGRYIPSNEVFLSEETVQSLFRGAQDPPDIIVCMDEVETKAAYQAVIAYNRVGKTQVIGYYKSNASITAVANNILSMTLVIDTKQMGEYAAKALSEYIKDGRANSFYSVDLELITKEMAQEILENEAADR